MTKREIDMTSEGSQDQSAPRVKLGDLCQQMGLHYVTYTEKIPGQKDERTVFFIHERGEPTGVKFLRKASMAAEIALFATAHKVFGTSLVIWAGLRGHHIQSAMDPKEREEKARWRAARAALTSPSTAPEVRNALEAATIHAA